MKYYYNGKLVRTSKHEYKYAVKWGDSIKSYHTTYELAIKAYTKWLHNRNIIILRSKEYIKSLEQGKLDITLKICGITREEEILMAENELQYQLDNYIQIIELKKEDK